MISRFRRYAREHGVSAALQKGTAEVRRKAFSEDRITIFFKPLDAIVEPARLDPITVEPLEERHLAGLAELNRRRGRPRVDRRFRDYVDRGLNGFVGLSDGEVIGYYWWVDCAAAGTHPDLGWLGGAVQIQPGDVYGSDFYLLPEARGGRVAATFLYFVETSLAELGFTRLWGYVDSGNRQARWVYSSRGYLPQGELEIRRMMSRRRVTPIL